MKPNVFLSSTFFDLIDYRSQVWDRLSKQNYQILGMEKFGARSEKPLSTCMSELEKARVYIGIIGMRYGSIETGSQKSYTQLEYEHAVSRNIPALIYMIDEEKALIHPAFVDHENYTVLCEFKKQLKNNHTISFFENPDDLASKIETDLRQHLSKKQSVAIKIPKRLKSYVFRHKLKTVNYCAIVSYYNNKPFQIYISPNKNLYIPDFVKRGVVEYDKKNNVYSFEFIDFDGYTVTIRGISRGPLVSKLINSLLLRKISFDKIKEIVIGIQNDLPKYEKPIIEVFCKLKL